MSHSSEPRKTAKGAVAIPAVAAAMIFAGTRKDKQREDQHRQRKLPPLRREEQQAA